MIMTIFKATVRLISANLSSNTHLPYFHSVLSPVLFSLFLHYFLSRFSFPSSPVSHFHITFSTPTFFFFVTFFYIAAGKRHDVCLPKKFLLCILLKDSIFLHYQLVGNLIRTPDRKIISFFSSVKPQAVADPVGYFQTSNQPVAPRAATCSESIWVNRAMSDSACLLPGTPTCWREREVSKTPESDVAWAQASILLLHA